MKLLQVHSKQPGSDCRAAAFLPHQRITLYRLV